MQLHKCMIICDVALTSLQSILFVFMAPHDPFPYLLCYYEVSMRDDEHVLNAYPWLLEIGSGVGCFVRGIKGPRTLHTQLRPHQQRLATPPSCLASLKADWHTIQGSHLQGRDQRRSQGICLSVARRRRFLLLLLVRVANFCSRAPISLIDTFFLVKLFCL